MRRLLPVIPILFLAACGQTAAPPEDNVVRATAASVESGTLALRIMTGKGERTLIVEPAVTEAQQERGLMHRPPLPPGRGMLFPFALPRTASFWMKDTPAPLDLIFVRPDGTIAAILDGKPNDLTPVSAGEPVSAVVEIGAGEAARLGLAPGDRVQWGDCAEGRTAPGQPINPLAFCPAP